MWEVVSSGVIGLEDGGNRHLSEQRILGEGEFVEHASSEMDAFGKENLRLVSHRVDLPVLAERICEVHRVRIGKLSSGSHRHEIVEARRVMPWLAVKELGYSGPEVARYLGATNSSITRAGNRSRGRST
jgi:putative transposase